MPKIEQNYYLDQMPKSTAPDPSMGQDAFLKILVAQLQNQDPMSPMEDKEFIAQMATFSSLEQTMKMRESIDLLVQSQMVSPVIQYSHMIGKEITYKDEEDKNQTSIVKSVSQKDGWAILELENDEKVYADAVIKINGKENKE